jgi:hypothetical protein
MLPAALQLGASSILRKPLQLSELLATIERSQTRPQPVLGMG